MSRSTCWKSRSRHLKRLSALNLQITECQLGTLRTISMANPQFRMSPKLPVPNSPILLAPYCCSRLYQNTGKGTPNVEHWKVTQLWLPLLLTNQVCLCQTGGRMLKRSDCWKSRFWKLFALSASVLKLLHKKSRLGTSKNILIANPHCHYSPNLPVPITKLKSDKF